MKFCTVSILSFMAAAMSGTGHVPVTVMAEHDDYISNPQQTDTTERPCEAECVMKDNCYEVCEYKVSGCYTGGSCNGAQDCCDCTMPWFMCGSGKDEIWSDDCAPLCPDVVPELICEVLCDPPYEECTFEVGRNEISSELGYFIFKGKGDDYCGGGETNPVLGIKKGATYLFTQRRTGNYYHPLGFAYGADGALDDQPELEPGICPGTKKGEEDSTECACLGEQICEDVCAELPGVVKINDAATVLEADVMASNGVIHVIDAVLVPPSIDVAAFLATCPEVSSSSRALEDQGTPSPYKTQFPTVGTDDYDYYYPPVPIFRTDCPCSEGEFCNYDKGDTGFCELCYSSKEACLDDGLPEKGATDCVNACGFNDDTNIWATLRDEGMNTLIAAIDIAACNGGYDLSSVLSEGEGPLTVFAPTNEAFDALPAKLVSCLFLPENQEVLTDILTYHVASGKVVSSELSNGQQIPTVQGENVDIAITQCDEVCTYPDALCPAPMYYTGNKYLGEYSNNPMFGFTASDDFGLDAYEPQFFLPLLTWKGTPREEDPEGPGYYQAALFIPEEEEFDGDFFYFCHIHQYMTGRFKFVDEEGMSINPKNTPRIPYEYQEPDMYDQSCGSYGISDSRLPDDECPSTFVCDAPDAAVAPFAAKFAQCVDSMNCAMLKGITTKIQSDSVVALFNHQMIPHHQQAVNMCKALDIAKGTECDDIFDEEDPKCVLKVLCQEIINVQNAQIQTMQGVLASLDYKETDNCVVKIPLDPKVACLDNSSSDGYTWCTLTQTCVPPGDDSCLKANCEQDNSSTGYEWCTLTQTCVAPGDDSCKKAECALLRSTDYVWCTAAQQCLRFADCERLNPTAPPTSRPTRNKSSKSSKSDRRN